MFYLSLRSSFYSMFITQTLSQTQLAHNPSQCVTLRSYISIFEMYYFNVFVTMLKY
jgi:hypothetical protein